MSDHKFNNPELLQVLEYREWIREKLPSSRDGVVVEDVDLLIRLWGENYDTDGEGKFMFIECKFGSAVVKSGLAITYRLMDRLLRKADPEGERYRGWYVVQYTDSDWEKAGLKLNGVKITKEQLYKFLLFEDIGVPPKK